MNYRISKTFLVFGLLLFILFGALGISYFGMNMNMKQDQMANCPFSGFTAICKMSPLEHITIWQNMFMTLPLKDIYILANLILLAIFSLSFLRYLWSKNNLHTVSIYSQRFRYSNYLVRNKLQQAFSDGILNPKIF